MIWKGIAIAGIWVGLGIVAKYAGDSPTTFFGILFGALASIVIAGML